MSCDLLEFFAAIRWRSFLCSASALFVALAAGCGKRNAYVPPPPPEVVVGTPVVRTVTLYHEFPGTTQASESVSIIPRVLGLRGQPALSRTARSSPRINSCSSSIRARIKMPTTSPSRRSTSTKPVTRTRRPTTPAPRSCPRPPAPSASKTSTCFRPKRNRPRPTWSSPMPIWRTQSSISTSRISPRRSAARSAGDWSTSAIWSRRTSRCSRRSTNTIRCMPISTQRSRFFGVPEAAARERGGWRNPHAPIVQAR